MPKLLQISADSGVFSVGKITEDIASVVLKHGWESYVAYGRDSKPCSSQTIKIGTKFDVYEHYFEFKLLDNEGLASRSATKHLIASIKEIRPDIIHLHVLHDHYLNFKLLFEYLASIETPIVWTLHDCWSMTGGCMYFDLFNCEKWKTMCDNCPERRSIVNKAKRNHTLKNLLLSKIKNLTFVPVSKWLGDYVGLSKQSYRPIFVIHNGIDISKFTMLEKSEHHNNARYKVLGVAAVWDERKGLKDFFMLRELLPKDEYEITIVGLSKRQLEILPAGIKGIQRTHNFEELVKLYSESDVFVNPTYSDNFPTTNIESLACGTPVITYNTGGSPEAIDEDTGKVVPRGEILSLQQAIEEMRSNPLSRTACRKRAERLYDKNKCFEAYYDLYNAVLSNKV